MRKKTFTPEHNVVRLPQIEVLLRQGTTVPLACKEGGIVDQTYYWGIRGSVNAIPGMVPNAVPG